MHKNPFVMAHAAQILVGRMMILAQAGKMPISVTVRPHNIFPDTWVAELGRHSGTGKNVNEAVMALSDHILEDCA